MKIEQAAPPPPKPEPFRPVTITLQTPAEVAYFVGIMGYSGAAVSARDLRTLQWSDEAQRAVRLADDVGNLQGVNAAYDMLLRALAS